MANYKATVDSKLSPEEAFEYLADFTNAAEGLRKALKADRVK